MRGGTSRALIFHERDLPLVGADGDTSARDAIFCAAIGAPDPNGRQLNGLGGGVTSLSKVAIVGPPSRPDADVDYTFGQVGVTAPTVGYRGNCGNISAAIGPFAVDEGLVARGDGDAVVTIHNTNTRKLIRARFPVRGGRAVSAGDFAIDGVAGTGARIELAFLDPGGAATGRLLPTGHRRETLAIAGFGDMACSIVDAANPVVFVAAASLGLNGMERPADLGADAALMAALHAIRAAGAVAAGMIGTRADAVTLLPNLPLVALVSPAPDDAGDARGLTVRMISADQPHGASPLTGAICAAVAAELAGTIVRELVGPDAAAGRPLTLYHPTGTLSVAAHVVDHGDTPTVHEGIVHRTARRLMDGMVYLG